MVPRQFDALIRRQREHHLRLEFGPAIICQHIQAIAGNKTSYTTFMPSHRAKPEPEPDWKQLLSKVNVLHEAHGGAQ